MPDRARSAAAGRLLATAVLALLAAACTYGGNIDSPVTLKATWFSYLNGDDIRQRCSLPAAPDEMRLVYNGEYREQIRSYEVVRTTGGEAFFTARVLPRTNLKAITSEDPLGPWRWRRSQRRLSAEEMQALEAALSESGLYRPAPAGLRLPSDGFYWLAVACRDGRLHFNAWRHPSERWRRLSFPEVLLAYDETGVPLRAPSQARSNPQDRSTEKGEGASARFVLEVGERGLVGLP